jgi:prevent-host-death family protein
MKKASISILKAHLSRYVAAVKSGEEIIVTERGRPVARLCRLDPDSAPSGRAATLVREGRMRVPTGVVEDRGRGAEDPKGRSLRALLEERSKGP